jgi:hypothetical protein
MGKVNLQLQVTLNVVRRAVLIGFEWLTPLAKVTLYTNKVTRIYTLHTRIYPKINLFKFKKPCQKFKIKKLDFIPTSKILKKKVVLVI